MKHQTSFTFFKRYNETGTRIEMWCYPEQKTFSIWFEQEFCGLYFPVAALRVKHLKDVQKDTTGTT